MSIIITGELFIPALFLISWEYQRIRKKRRGNWLSSSGEFYSDPFHMNKYLKINQKHLLIPGKPDYLEVDDNGRLIVPPEVLARYSLKKGDRVQLFDSGEKTELKIPSHLRKLYIEPTTLCNLNCRTCIRNSWNEPLGHMSEASFDRIIEGLQAFNPVPGVFFGGLGEPLHHPRIIDMVKRVKALGGCVELITNGTLLTYEMSKNLIQAGLDFLWLSLDGATPESFADVRLGTTLPLILKNMESYQAALVSEMIKDRHPVERSVPISLGIVFVAMKRNIAELPDVVALARKLGAEKFLVTNVLPYTPDMVNEALYYNTFAGDEKPFLDLPPLDLGDETYESICKALRLAPETWKQFTAGKRHNYCPFIEGASAAVSWDGGISPCLPLMHSSTTWLGHLVHEKRYNRKWAVGSINERSLPEIWRDPEYVRFRERVSEFDFAPCSYCGACELIESNEDDCFYSGFPTCSGCLWAQGVIRCP